MVKTVKSIFGKKVVKSVGNGLPVFGVSSVAKDADVVSLPQMNRGHVN
jgi:hypothetical protein